jgi:hypothetical protein
MTRYGNNAASLRKARSRTHLPLADEIGSERGLKTTRQADHAVVLRWDYATTTVGLICRRRLRENRR